MTTSSRWEEFIPHLGVSTAPNLSFYNLIYPDCVVAISHTQKKKKKMHPPWNTVPGMIQFFFFLNEGLNYLSAEMNL